MLWSHTFLGRLSSRFSKDCNCNENTICASISSHSWNGVWPTNWMASLSPHVIQSLCSGYCIAESADGRAMWKQYVFFDTSNRRDWCCMQALGNERNYCPTINNFIDILDEFKNKNEYKFLCPVCFLLKITSKLNKQYYCHGFINIHKNIKSQISV